MAHGGHCGGSHYSHSRYSGGGGSIPTPVLVIAILIAIGIAIISHNSYTGKKPLEGSFSKYPQYLIDKEEYFHNSKDLVEGLTYLHEKTNVQVVVMSSDKSWSDSKAVDEYYKLFDDEAHILIIVPTAWYSNTTYYAIGDLADTVISDSGIKHIIDKIDKSKNGEKWEKELIKFTDLILEE